MADVAVRAITKRFGDVTALNGIDLDVRDGELDGSKNLAAGWH